MDPNREHLSSQLQSLVPEERLALAALAVVGGASVSIDALGEVAGIADGRRAAEGLARTGLVVEAPGQRLAVAPGSRATLKRQLASSDAVERALRGFTRLAEYRRLAPDDLDAVDELTRVAAETGRWEELLRLAEAAETPLSATPRVEDWAAIVERRLEAASMLGDEDAVARARGELNRLPHLVPAPPAAPAQRSHSGGGSRTALAVLGAVVLAAVGIGAGYLIGSGTAD